MVADVIGDYGVRVCAYLTFAVSFVPLLELL